MCLAVPGRIVSLQDRDGTLMADMLRQCGLPEDVFQVATGDGSTGAALIGQVDCVMFTGSSRTGKAGMRAAAEDTSGAVVAGVSALVLVIAALWLQHCCKSPQDPTDYGEGAES